VIVVCFFFGLQHIFLPFEQGWRAIVVRFVPSFVTGVILSLLYLRWRRLLSIHVLHVLGNLILTGLLPLLTTLAPGG
jgi:membrane protease YdiL (CAAX protease family)